MDLSQLEAFIIAQLQAHPQGIGEFELLKALQAAGIEGFPDESLTNSLPLFRMHFLLFHLLYRLRDRLWQTEQGFLTIDPLNIQLLPYTPGKATLTQPDPLRDYYLNLSHLTTTTAEDVEKLLTAFWVKYYAGEQQQAALEILELHLPVNYEQIKQQYRKLVMQHHPDRGGDTERLQAINTAMDILTRYYHPQD